VILTPCTPSLKLTTMLCAPSAPTPTTPRTAPTSPRTSWWKSPAIPNVVAIGETGLDFHYNYSPREDQFPSLRAHIEAARRTGLPIILHCREADLEMAELLEEEMGKGAFRPLLHCYTGGAELAERAAKLGAYFSASGIISFKKAEDVRAVFRDVIPDDRIIIETDCPYLAPVPHRGKRNEPSYLPHVAEALSAVKGWTLEETAERTTKNARTLFDRLPGA
jgi:TatD DNase family protein